MKKTMMMVRNDQRTQLQCCDVKLESTWGAPCSRQRDRKKKLVIQQQPIEWYVLCFKRFLKIFSFSFSSSLAMLFGSSSSCLWFFVFFFSAFASLRLHRPGCWTGCCCLLLLCVKGFFFFKPIFYIITLRFHPVFSFLLHILRAPLLCDLALVSLGSLFGEETGFDHCALRWLRQSKWVVE